MDIARAKEYFELGLVTGAWVRAPYMSFDGWTIELEGTFGNASPTIQTSRGKIRDFKTLETAAKVVREIGLKQFKVITD